MVILLSGYRGSGKTSVGRKLADRLWWKFLDLDALVQKKAGMSIRDIFEKHGEERFRDLESEALREALALSDHVVALGGGTLVREENRAAVEAADCRVFYLRCEPEELIRRIEADSKTQLTRPPLTHLGGGIDEVRAKLNEREGVYRQTADVELDVTSLSVDEVVARLARFV